MLSCYHPSPKSTPVVTPITVDYTVLINKLKPLFEQVAIDINNHLDNLGGDVNITNNLQLILTKLDLWQSLANDSAISVKNLEKGLTTLINEVHDISLNLVDWKSSELELLKALKPQAAETVIKNWVRNVIDTVLGQVTVEIPEGCYAAQVYCVGENTLGFVVNGSQFVEGERLCASYDFGNGKNFVHPKFNVKLPMGSKYVVEFWHLDKSKSLMVSNPGVIVAEELDVDIPPSLLSNLIEG